MDWVNCTDEMPPTDIRLLFEYTYDENNKVYGYGTWGGGGQKNPDFEFELPGLGGATENCKDAIRWLRFIPAGSHWPTPADPGSQVEAVELLKWMAEIDLVYVEDRKGWFGKTNWKHDGVNHEQLITLYKQSLNEKI